MSITAMKQALNDANAALKKAAQCIKDLGEENERLRQAIAEANHIPDATKMVEQEPVPRVVLREGSPTLLSDKAILPTDQRLYTHPDPDALNAAYIMGVQDGKKMREPLTAAQWVGLTDEEMNEAMAYWSDKSRSAYGGAYSADEEYVSMVSTWRYIEAKLKEKNT